MLLIALLRTLWGLSYRDMHDWPALACGLSLGKDGRPCIPSTSQQCKRGQQGGAAQFHEAAWVEASPHTDALVVNGPMILADSGACSQATLMV